MTELTPEQQKEVQELHAALRSEFEEREANPSVKSAKKDIEELKEDMLSALSHILKHGANEGLKAKVAMWGYDRLLEENKANTDPIRALIAGMPPPAPLVVEEDDPDAPSEEEAKKYAEVPLDVLEATEPDEDS